MLGSIHTMPRCASRGSSGTPLKVLRSAAWGAESGRTSRHSVKTRTATFGRSGGDAMRSQTLTSGSAADGRWVTAQRSSVFGFRSLRPYLGSCGATLGPNGNPAIRCVLRADPAQAAPSVLLGALATCRVRTRTRCGCPPPSCRHAPWPCGAHRAPCPRVARCTRHISGIRSQAPAAPWSRPERPTRTPTWTRPHWPRSPASTIGGASYCAAAPNCRMSTRSVLIKSASRRPS